MNRRLGGRSASATALVAGLVVALPALLAGCGGSSSQAGAHPPRPSASTRFEPTPRDLNEIRAVVAQRANALNDRDVHEFLATVDPTNDSLRSHQRTLFDNLTELSGLLASYSIDTSVLLVPDPVPGSDPTVRPSAVEHIAFSTFPHPVGNPLHLTFVRRDGHWVVGADNEEDDPSRLAAAQERPWFGVPVAVRRAGPMTVIVDQRKKASLGSLTAEIHDDIRVVASLLDIPARYRLLVDATSNGGTTSFSSTSNEQAAAVTFGVYDTDRAGEKYTDFAGMVIKVNPRLVDQLATNTALLRHELTHYLLSEDYSGGSPKWLSEGIATWVQYYPDDYPSLAVRPDFYRRLQHADRRLPVVGLFNTDPAVNYQIAQAAVTWLVDHYGVAKVLTLMKAYRDDYAGADVDALTPRLLRQVFGVTEKQVVDGAFGLLASYQH
jgi:hypothetical protein